MRPILFLVTALVALSTASQAYSESGSKTTPEPVGTTYNGLALSPTPLELKMTTGPLELIGRDDVRYALPSLMVPDTPTDLDARAAKRLADIMGTNRCTPYQTRNTSKGRLNRMNEKLVHLECGKDKIWVNGQLVREGLAVVWPVPSNTELVGELLELEQIARKERQGVWNTKLFPVLTPETAASRMNSRAIVQGKVLNVAQTKDAVFLNFTQDWKTDFTIGIPNALRRDFARANLSLLSLKGQTVRVRGWVQDYNGPFIELDTPAQLEILSPASDSKKSDTMLDAITTTLGGDGSAIGMHSITSNRSNKADKPDAPTAPTAPKKPELSKPAKPVTEQPKNDSDQPAAPATAEAPERNEPETREPETSEPETGESETNEPETREPAQESSDGQ